MKLKFDVLKKLCDLIEGGEDKITEVIEFSSKHRVLKEMDEELLIKYLNKVGNKDASLYQLKLCMKILKILIKRKKPSPPSGC